MKLKLLIVLLLLGFINQSFTALSIENRVVDSVESVEAQPPVEKKKKSKLKRKKGRKQAFSKQKKKAPEEKSGRYGYWILMSIGGLLVLGGGIALFMYTLSISVSFGSLGCSGAIGAIIGIFFLYIFSVVFIIAGAVLVVMGIVVFFIRKHKHDQFVARTGTNSYDYLDQEKRKASALFPNYIEETLNEYAKAKLTIEQSLLELEVLEARKARRPSHVRTPRLDNKINHYRETINKKKALIERFAIWHEELSIVPKENQWDYMKLQKQLLKQEQSLESLKNRTDKRGQLYYNAKKDSMELKIEELKKQVELLKKGK